MRTGLRGGRVVLFLTPDWAARVRKRCFSPSIKAQALKLKEISLGNQYWQCCIVSATQCLALEKCWLCNDSVATAILVISTTVLLCTIVLPVDFFLFRLNRLGFDNSRIDRARNEPISPKNFSHHLIESFLIKYHSLSSKFAVNPQTEILLFVSWEIDQTKPRLAINHHFCLDVT